MKRIFFAVLFLGAFVFLFTGCDPVMVKDDVKVINNSSYAVTMTNIKSPANKTEIVGLPAGGTDTLTYKHDSLEGFQISFLYTPANLVNADIDSKKLKITFTDK